MRRNVKEFLKITVLSTLFIIALFVLLGSQKWIFTFIILYD